MAHSKLNYRMMIGVILSYIFISYVVQNYFFIKILIMQDQNSNLKRAASIVTPFSRGLLFVIDLTILSMITYNLAFFLKIRIRSVQNRGEKLSSYTRVIFSIVFALLIFNFFDILFKFLTSFITYSESQIMRNIILFQRYGFYTTVRLLFDSLILLLLFYHQSR